MTTDFRALCAELTAWAEKTSAHYFQPPDVLLRARAALADEPAVPAPPADGEVAKLVAWLRETGDTIQPSHLAEHQRYKRAAELLEQMEDLAADAVAGLRYIEESCGRLYGVGWDRVYGKADRLKPAHSLPLPEVGE